MAQTLLSSAFNSSDDLTLERFKSHLIEFPEATDDLSSGVRVQAKEQALLRRYLALNHRLGFYIAVDIDRAGAAFAWEHANLPSPTIITINPVNAHAHLLWELTTPVATTSKGRRSPIEYFGATRRALRDRLQGDVGYAGYLTKNPLHPSWRVITFDKTYELAEFQEYLDLSERRMRIEEDSLGRNCSLFETLRHWAYRNVSGAGSFEHWQCLCESVATDFNTFDIPLPIREVRDVARSVARWTWARRESIADPNAGVMGFAPISPHKDEESRCSEIQARQSAAARYTHNRQRTRTAGAIERAANELGLNVDSLRDRDASRIAIRAHLGINTVRRFIADRPS